MAKINNKERARRRPDTSMPSPFEQARDELFQHIMRCGVVGADPEHQTEWFDETMVYFAQRFPELETEQVTELRTLGERFSRPPMRQTAPAATDDAASAA